MATVETIEVGTLLLGSEIDWVLGQRSTVGIVVALGERRVLSSLTNKEIDVSIAGACSSAVRGMTLFDSDLLFGDLVVVV